MKRIPIAGTTDRWNVGTVYCLGKNYRAHAREMGEHDEKPPVVFLKPAAALVDATQPIVLPRGRGAVHHEIELVLAIAGASGMPPFGEPVSDTEADRMIAGFTIGLDLTLRDLQTEAKRAGEPWSAAKGFPGSAPMGAIVMRQPEHRFEEMRVRLEVNGDCRQEGAVSEMILSPRAAVAHVAGLFPLEEGDLIFTGTPAGVGPLSPGDRLVARLDPLLSISLTVAS